jgi:TolB-like protein/thioredoxin-like negative regulator of GroEL
MGENAGEKQRLDSWKAIARHLGRSVRTARRWEQEEQMPVHRLMHGSQGSVYAFSSELDAWQASRSRGPASGSNAGDASAGKHDVRAAAAPQHPASIAVLPFGFSGPEASQRWVADGLTEETIAGFSRLQQLRVTSRTSSGAFAESNRNSAEIASALGVLWLLEGSVLGDGQRLRINVRLIDGAKDEHIWSEQFVGTMDDVFDIQERIARRVVAAIQLQLDPDDSGKLREHATDNVGAWRRVVLARQAALRWHPDALEQARSLLEDALTLTGENAAICATMGRVLLNYREAGIPLAGDPVAEAESWARRASAADAHHPETLIVSGWLAYANGDMPSAIRLLEQALREDRDHPDGLALLVNCLLLTGQVQRARPIIEHLMAVDPVTPLTRCMPGFADAMEGRFEDAIGPYADMLELDPQNPLARLFNVWLRLAAGDVREARTLVAAFPEALADSAAAQIATFLLAAFEAQASVTRLPPDVTAVAAGNEMLARFIAEGCALAGDAAATAHWLGLSADQGFANWPYLSAHSPGISRLADDPALEMVLARIKRAWQALASHTQA